jgi:uncharacterized protein DUF4383
MNVRYFAMGIGVIYVIAGLLGFLPAAVTAPLSGAPDVAVTSGYGYLLGLFPVNVLHNLAHLAIGIWGIWAYSTYPHARNFSRGLAVFYGVLTVMGLIPVLNTTFGLIPIFGHDVWLHGLTAMVAGYYGWSGMQAMNQATEQVRRRA